MASFARARRSYGMPETLLRHGTVLLLSAGAVVAQGGTLSVAIMSQPWSWLAVAIAVGVLSAIIAGRLLGVAFLVFGFGIGIEMLLVTKLGSTAQASLALQRDGYLYGAMLAAAVEAFLLTMLLLVWVRRRSA
jgi:hypothetical protein